MKPELYFSVDIESSGPIPSKYSMLSLGACLVDNIEETFYIEIQPISNEFVPEAIRISGFDLDRLKREGIAPKEAMFSFKNWIELNSKESRAVFVGFNACYDWQFVNWYLEFYTGSNPFGFGGIDIKSYFMGLSRETWSQTTSSQLPAKFRPDKAQTHNALDDAQAQATIFRKMFEAKNS